MMTDTRISDPFVDGGFGGFVSVVVIHGFHPLRFVVYDQEHEYAAKKLSGKSCIDGRKRVTVSFEPYKVGFRALNGSPSVLY